MRKKTRSHQQKKLSYNSQILEALHIARTSCRMTQKELALKSGINQANISKIENGIYNPSLTIIRRLAEAMDMDLQLKLIPREDQPFCTSSSSSSVGTANV